MPRRNPISVAEVANVFDDDCIDALRLYLPRVDNVHRFAEELRTAARAYAQGVDALSSDEVRIEIADLLKFANFQRPSTRRTTGKKYEKVARKLERLSERARRMLTDRAAGMSQAPKLPAPSARAIGRTGEILTRKPFSFSVTLPSPADLRDPLLREKACEAITLLCSSGARPGKRGIEFDLHAPGVASEPRSDGSGGNSIRKRRAKRNAELEFVSDLRLLWVTATGEQAAWTGNSYNPGPLVRFAAACLERVGAYDEDRAEEGASRLIRETDRRRRIAEERSKEFSGPPTGRMTFLSE